MSWKPLLRLIVTSVYCLPRRKKSSTVVDTDTGMAAVGVSGGEAVAGTADVEINVEQEMSQG